MRKLVKAIKTSEKIDVKGAPGEPRWRGGVRHYGAGVTAVAGTMEVRRTDGATVLAP